MISLQSNSCAWLAVRFSPWGCVLFWCPLLQPDEWPHGELGGGRGCFGHVKRHLWGFEGPLHDGRGSASGGSNFSKPWGGAAGSDLVCVCVGCARMHVACFRLCRNFENKFYNCYVGVSVVFVLDFISLFEAKMSVQVCVCVCLFGQSPCKHILCVYTLTTVIAFNTTRNTTQIMTESHPQLMIM